MITIEETISAERFFDFVVPQMRKRFNRGVETALYQIGNDLARKQRMGIERDPKTGRMYDGKRASAPGQSPQIRTGAYVRSIDYNVRGSKSVEYGVNTPYAEFLELGTSKMEPRKGVKDTYQGEARNVVNYLHQHTKEAFW